MERGSRGLDQIQQGPERVRVAIVRRCCEQQQPARPLTQCLSESGPLSAVRVLWRPGLGQCVGLVRYDQVPPLAESALADCFLLEKVHGRDHSREAVPWAHPSRQLALVLGDRGGVVDDIELEVELLPQLLTPLLHEARRSHN